MELTPTQERIHESAKGHFLEYGFQGASLRKIVSDAGFTLGAFYGYYQSKEELFDALVGETARGIVGEISKMGDRADSIPPDQRSGSMTQAFAAGLPRLLDYLLAHLDETRLLLKCSTGTKYENFLSDLMDRDLAFVRDISPDQPLMHPLAERLLVQGYFSALDDAVLSGLPRDDIERAMNDIDDVYAGGIVSLLKGRQKQ